MLTRPVSDYATERKTLSSTEVPLCSVSDTATERKTLSTIKVPLCSMLGRVTRAMSVALLLRNNPKRKRLHLLAHDDDDELMLNVLRCHLTY